MKSNPSKPPEQPITELCSARYRAEQVPGVVMIHATGSHRTSGYHPFFEQMPMDVFPPKYRLWHTRPTGPVLEVIVPFAISTSFPADTKVAQVEVRDATGVHEVVVEQVPDERRSR